jgi:G:T/U-mismatch repair DNA glycosylase
MTNPNQNIEQHPLMPFLPKGAKVLMLGSFPPKRERWSMEFFYPNWINDMWRLVGLIFFREKRYFEVDGEKCFDAECIMAFCAEQGLALFDAATQVRRLKGNASDKFLEVVAPTDIKALLNQLPDCSAVVVTGQKAMELVVEQFGCPTPVVGGYVEVSVEERQVRLWRMPSTSRAYPLPLEQKADAYRKMFAAEGILAENQ